MTDSRETRSMYIAKQGRRLCVEEITGIAITGAFFRLSVCVLCWTEELRRGWEGRLARFPSTDRLEGLDLWDANRLTLDEWTALLDDRAYDLVIMHGVQAAYRSDQLSAKYAAALVNAVPAEMIMWV